MARLILEEGGETRRFKLSSGKLTFGGGGGATLKLTGDDIADLHGEIQMSEEGAVLRTAKGVMPAKVGGRPVQKAHTMKHGQAVHVGGAKLTVEYDEGEGPAGATGSRAGAAAPTKRAAAGGGGGGGARVARRRPQAKKSSVPTPLIVIPIIAIAIFGVTRLLGSTTKGLSGEEFDFDVRYARYEREVAIDAVGARTILNEIARQTDLTAQQRALVDAELNKADKSLVVIDDALRNEKATPWFSTRLRSFYDKWPVSKERAYARLFMKRAKWFIGEYPTHPENDWIRRIMDRVEDVSEPGAPMVFEDLKVDVWGSTAAEPKDFKEALDEIDSFIASASDEGSKSSAENLLATTLDDERAFHKEKMDDAKIVYDKIKYPKQYQPAEAIEDMIRIIVGCRTATLRDDAATRLMQISEFTPGILKSYKLSQPLRFAKMMEMPDVRAFAEENGLAD